MYISARERKILETLLTADRETTLQEIADDLDVSVRTVQRDIKGAEALLRKFGILLDKKPGNGLKTTGTDNRKRQLLQVISEAIHTDYTSEERQAFILSILLRSTEPIKQHTLANELKVAGATIGNDLDKIGDLLHRYDMTLVRKRGFGVEIEGTETAKRRMMSQLIQRHTDEIELLSLFRSKDSPGRNKQMNELNGRLLGLIDKELLIAVEHLVTAFIRKNNNQIADSAYIGLIVHLALAIERVSEGKRVVNTLPSTERLTDSKEYETAAALLSVLEDTFLITFPEDEKSHIAMHLMGAKALGEKELLPGDDPSLWLYTQKLIALTGSRLGMDLTEKDSLYNGLVTHLKPAVYRLEKKMGIQNPLLPSIKKEYRELFEIIKQTAGEVLPHLQIPDEEIGFLVMHFASAMLMDDDMKALSALVVCTSGIGTSKILTARILKEFPEVKSIRNVSAFELHTLQLDEYDLIVSTVHLDLKKSYFLVNPFLTDRDIGEIKAAIPKAAVNKSMKQHPEPKPESKDFLLEIKRLTGYTEAIESVLEHFSINETDSKSKEQLIRFISSTLAKENLVLNEEKLAEDLLLRENKGGTGIPGTGLALLHARSEAVLVPLFTIFRLREPLPFAGMDDSLTHMRSAMVMLLPANPKVGAVDVMSHISSMIIEDDASVKLLEFSHESEVNRFLARGLKQFLGEKITTQGEITR